MNLQIASNFLQKINDSFNSGYEIYRSDEIDRQHSVPRSHRRRHTSCVDTGPDAEALDKRTDRTTIADIQHAEICLHADVITRSCQRPKLVFVNIRQ